MVRSVSGSVYGGQQPIAGAQIALYAAGKTGTGSSARSMLSSNPTTDATGGFNITGTYTCQPGDQVYLAATGGDAGGGTNNAIALMAALGSCATLQANAATTFVNVDEVTTVASVFAVANFMSGLTQVGSDAAHANALAGAFATTQTMVNTTNGTAPATSAGNGIVPQATIYSLANSIATCINSTPGSNACSELFSDTSAGGTAPTDTVGATLNIAHHPTANTSAIFLLASPAPPFQPTLSAAPSSYALAVAHPSDVLMYHNDAGRTGVQAYETTLTPANVTSAKFGKLFTFPVDSYQFAQPLYVGGVGMPDGAVHNLVVASTTHGTMFVFDADGNNPGAGSLWSLNYIPSGQRIYTASDLGGCSNPPEAGILGTPVIDRATQTIYFVVKSATSSGSTFYHSLHAVSLLDGSEQPGSPSIVNPTFSGTGAGSSGGTYAFNPLHQSQRAALLLTPNANGSGKTVWIAYASQCDAGPYHGLVLGYDASNVATLTAKFINTPNGSDGGIWGGAGGPVADAQSNLYVLGGNGTFDVNTGGLDYGDSAVKLGAPSGGSTTMPVADYFTPSNQAYLNSHDLDLGGTEAILFHDPASGVAPNLLIATDKNGYVYLLNASDMGTYGTGTHGVDGKNRDLQDFPAGGEFIYNFSFFNNALYTSNPVRAYGFQPGGSNTAGSFNATALAQKSFNGNPVVSANGTANAIVWTQDTGGTLHADTASLTTELYNTTLAGSRDTPAPFVKFTSPVIANGKVYLSGQGALVVYGLLP